MQKVMDKMKKLLILFLTSLFVLNTVSAIVLFNYDENNQDKYIEEVNKVLQYYDLEKENIRIEFYNNPDYYSDYCGLTWPFSNRILIFNHAYCDYKETIEHETLHYVYFKFPIKQQIDYCNYLSLDYSNICWEYFVEDMI